MNKRSLILTGGVALYALGMWLAWFDEQQHLGRGPTEWANHETASTMFVLAGVVGVLVGTISMGLRLTNTHRALGGTGMILGAITTMWLWAHGIDFLFLGPEIHGWSFGFILLPVSIVSGILWLLMSIRRRVFVLFR